MSSILPPRAAVCWRTNNLARITHPTCRIVDRAADAALVSASTNVWTFVDSQTGVAQTFGPYGVVANNDAFVPADYNGDGVTDCAMYRRADGKWDIAYACNTATSFSAYWGADASSPW